MCQKLKNPTFDSYLVSYEAIVSGKMWRNLLRNFTCLDLMSGMTSGGGVGEVELSWEAIQTLEALGYKYSRSETNNGMLRRHTIGTLEGEQYLEVSYRALLPLGLPHYLSFFNQLYFYQWVHACLQAQGKAESSQLVHI